MHEHSWYFVFAPARWGASCACGLSVEVELSVPGHPMWRWEFGGEAPPPAARMVGAADSVTRARRELLAARALGRN